VRNRTLIAIKKEKVTCVKYRHNKEEPDWTGSVAKLVRSVEVAGGKKAFSGELRDKFMNIAQEGEDENGKAKFPEQRRQYQEWTGSPL